ncbi:class I SAM-dependent methyltransferase [Actinopolymorpha pittospori]|uniref:Methyltransferase domain-containing protein n=1 Tax=Actinopolymorpha pittospori TaxID=648752 RepID=A0A927RCE0_9ACTN|nr:hypothetical protein [Actinopolymorpha pittospori]
MLRHEFLRTLHEVAQPRTYFEVGINDGRSLALSRVPTVAVDPAFKVVKELRCDLHMVRATSDDFFARKDPFEHLKGAKLDLAFIDGMHLFEFALRDFINAERHANPGTVVVFDDMLPRNVDEAARDRHTGGWTGDVYKIVPVLQRYRPDLVLALMDTSPTGVLVVLNLDPDNTVLSDKYDEIIKTYIQPDPQQVPDVLIQRGCAMTPDQVLEAAFWPAFVAARDSDSWDDLRQLCADIDVTFRETTTDPLTLAGWQPEPRAAAPRRAPAARAKVRPVAPRPDPGPRSLPQRLVRSAVRQPGLRSAGKNVLNRLPHHWSRAIRKRVYRTLHKA